MLFHDISGPPSSSDTSKICQHRPFDNDNIIIVITIITITITIIIIIITIMIIIITHLNKSRLTSDFKFQLLISAPHSVNCLAIIIPTTDMWPP